MEPTEYESAWTDGEEERKDSEPLQAAADAARRKQDEDRREYEEAYAEAVKEDEKRDEKRDEKSADDKESQE